MQVKGAVYIRTEDVHACGQSNKHNEGSHWKRRGKSGVHAEVSGLSWTEGVFCGRVGGRNGFGWSGTGSVCLVSEGVREGEMIRLKKGGGEGRGGRKARQRRG